MNSFRRHNQIPGNTIIFSGLMFFGILLNAQAGNPFVVINSEPVRWPENETIVYNLDPGHLGPISHLEAENMIQSAFEEWESTELSAIQFRMGNSLPEDINGNNYYTYLNSYVSGLNPIIFDSDGQILSSLYGNEAEETILGHTELINVSGQNRTILSARIIFNGSYILERQLNNSAFYATVLHELGHFIGLGHSQLLRHLAYDEVGWNDVYVPQMFPTTTDDESSRTQLTDDDRNSLVSLYPNPFASFRTGKITGKVQRNNQELPGINVIARRIGSVTDTIFSTVTGTYQANSGHFELERLPPGNYQLHIEPIDPFFTGISSVGPYTRYPGDISFQNPPQSRLYQKDSPISNRSKWSPIQVRSRRITAEININAGTQAATSDEINSQLLALNSTDFGAVPPGDISFFQYVLDLSGQERVVFITVTPKNAESGYGIIIKKNQRASLTDPSMMFARRGNPMTVQIGGGSEIPLEQGRYFIAIRNQGQSSLSYWIKTEAPFWVTTPTTTATPRPTNTPFTTPVITATPTPTKKPIKLEPTPTAVEVNPILGLVSLDEIGGVHPRGAAVHNFDIGITNKAGEFSFEGTYDGFPDPEALGPLLVDEGIFYPVAQDIEFSGEIDPNGNGSEGFYILSGGTIGDLPPVITRLGAMGGPNRGGIDLNNDPEDNIDFGAFQSDFVSIEQDLISPMNVPEFISPLVALEPAGNNGFYVLDRQGKIHAEGDAREFLDLVSPPITFATDAIAVDMVIFRGRTISLDNSRYSNDLIGTGAYILDDHGRVYRIGNVPTLSLENYSFNLQNEIFPYQDMELLPNTQGTEWIGLGVLNGSGMIHFIPFEGIEENQEMEDYIDFLNPFKATNGFSFDIARDFEVEISDIPIFGLNEQGGTVASTSRRVGIFMFDGYGGIHTGGRSTRFSPAFGISGEDSRIIEGFVSVPYPVTIPYFNTDFTRDVELSPRIQRSSN